MLRLWREVGPNSEVVIKVEGKLIDEWVAIVERECRGETDARSPVVLDLGSVTFVDGRGLAMLRSLAPRSIRMVNVTPLLQDQLGVKGDHHEGGTSMNGISETVPVTEPGATFEELLAAVVDPAFGTALHWTRNSHDAEDLVQETCLQAYRAFRTFQPGTNFKAWFFKIMTNLFYYRHRKAKRQPQTVDLDAAPDLYLYIQTANLGLHGGNQDPAECIMNKLEAEHVRAAIDQLPEEFRIACALYFIQDFSYDEIASILEKPIGTVRSRLHRGRKMLQKALWQVAEEAGITTALAEREP